MGEDRTLTLVLVRVWLLEVSSVLVHARRALTVLHGLLVSACTRLHADLRRDHVLRCVLNILSSLISLRKLGVVDSLLVTHIWP